jgi:hypothetical protein
MTHNFWSTEIDCCLISAVSDYLWSFWVFFLDCPFVLTSKSDIWTLYLPRTRSVEFFEYRYTNRYTSLYMVMVGVSETIFCRISTTFYYFWLLRWFPSVSSGVWVSLSECRVIWRCRLIFFGDFNHVQTQNNPVRKWSHLMHLGHGLILIHRTHFLSSSVARGLDSRLRDLIRSFTIMKYRILSQKIILIDDLGVEDHARVLYFWGRGGTLCTKIALKWYLEALTVTRNKRIAPGRPRSQM